MNEAGYIASVHRQLPPDIWRQKMATQFSLFAYATSEERKQLASYMQHVGDSLWAP